MAIDAKYFRLESSDTQGVDVLRLDTKKTSDALGFLKDIHEKLKEGHEIQLQVKDKSLKEVVTSVVSGCQAKIGILGMIWNCVLRILCITPAIDSITELADEIQNAEMTSTGISVFYFQARLTKIIDFFKNLPQKKMEDFFGADLMRDYNQCINAHFNRIDDCLECGKKLHLLFKKLESEWLGIINLHFVRVEFNRLFFIAARAAYKDENLKDAAEAMSRASFAPSVDDEEFVGRLVRDCLQANDIPNAQRALLEMGFMGHNIEKEILQAMIQQEPLRAENIRAAFERAKLFHFSVQGEMIGIIIDKCLKEKVFYDQAIEAASSLRDNYESLVKIASYCIDQEDFKNAKKAVAEIWTLAIKDPLVEKMARFYLNKNDYKAAQEIITSMSISSALQYRLAYEIANKYIEANDFKNAAIAHNIIWEQLSEYQTQARHIFAKCREMKDFASVILVTKTIIKEENIQQQLLEIVKEILAFKESDKEQWWKHAYSATRIAQLLQDKSLEDRISNPR